MKCKGRASQGRQTLMSVLPYCVITNRDLGKIFTLPFCKDEIFVEEAFVVKHIQHFYSLQQ